MFDPKSNAKPTKAFLNCFAVSLIVALAMPFPAWSQSTNTEKEDRSESDEEVVEDIVEELISNAARSNNSSKNNKHACVIVVTEGGKFGTSVDNSVLSSKLSRGLPGQAQVTTTNSSFELSIDPPLGFTSSPGATTDYEMVASMSGIGATNFSERPGTSSVRVKKGITEVQAHLQAKTNSGDPFAAGSYSSEITLRCE